MFKEIIKNDLNNVFFNVNEFAEPHNIDGKVVDCIVDNDRLIQRSKKEYDGISVGEILIFVKSKDLVKEPRQDMPIIFDKKQMYAFSVREDMGMYEIILTQNIGG